MRDEFRGIKQKAIFSLTCLLRQVKPFLLNVLCVTFAPQTICRCQHTFAVHAIQPLNPQLFFCVSLSLSLSPFVHPTQPKPSYPPPYTCWHCHEHCHLKTKQRFLLSRGKYETRPREGLSELVVVSWEVLSKGVTREVCRLWLLPSRRSHSGLNLPR